MHRAPVYLRARGRPRRAGKGGAALQDAVRNNADTFAAELAPVVAEIREAGHTSLRAVAAELNARGIRTRWGCRWHVSNVGKLLGRIGAPKSV